MEFTHQQITEIVGAQYLRIVWLEQQLAKSVARINELTPPDVEPKKKLEAVE